MQPGDSTPYGVLNIHRDMPGILRIAHGTEGMRQFGKLLGPFASILLILVKLLDEMGTRRGMTAGVQGAMAPVAVGAPEAPAESPPQEDGNRPPVA